MKKYLFFGLILLSSINVFSQTDEFSESYNNISMYMYSTSTEEWEFKQDLPAVVKVHFNVGGESTILISIYREGESNVLTLKNVEAGEESESGKTYFTCVMESGREIYGWYGNEDLRLIIGDSIMSIYNNN